MIVYPVVVGDLYGSMDRTVFYKVEDRCIGRKKNQSKEREYSEAEQEQHLKFGFMIKLSRKLKYVAKESLIHVPKYLSAVNYFMQLNLPYCTVEDLESGLVTFDYEQAVFAEGTVRKPKVTASYSEGQITLSIPAFTGKSIPGNRIEDRIFVVLLESQLMEAYSLELGVRGEETTLPEMLDPDWNVENVHVYAYVYSDKERETSDSVYVPIEGE